MPTFYFLRGLPASGKSTWAKNKLKERKYRGIVRINNDGLREVFHDGEWSGPNEKFIGAARDRLIELAISRRDDLVLDNTNINPAHMSKYENIAEQAGYKFEIVDFLKGPLAVSLEECIKRDSKRAHYVGEKVIRRMYTEWLREDKCAVKTPEHDANLPTYVVCDLDGTMALIGDRSPYDGTKVYGDAVNFPVQKAILSLIHAGEIQGVLFCSGREESSRQESTRWLADKAGFIVGPNDLPTPHRLFMRQTGDQRADSVVKREIYEQHIKGRYNVLMVFDDRSSVVALWRSLGLPTFQVNDGDF